MGNTAAASSHTNAPRDGANSKRKAKKSKNVPGKKSKKQQEAELAGIGSQFWQYNETQQSYTSTDYPQNITLDEE